MPCYNEEEGLREVKAVLPDFVDEIVVSDNNSTDRTVEVAREINAVVVHEKKQGYGAAYKTGLAAATKDVIVTFDADATYPADEIDKTIDHMIENDLDFISCSRFPLKNGQSMNFSNMVGNKIQTYTLWLLFFRKLQDSQSGMWVFKRKVLPLLHLTSDGMAFSEEIKIEAMTHKDIRFDEFHISYRERIGEVKLNKWKDGFDNMKFLFQKRFAMKG